MRERKGYKIVDGRYVRQIERKIKVKVKKSWTHLGKKTVVGNPIELSVSEYHFALDRGLVDEAADQPKMLEV